MYPGEGGALPSSLTLFPSPQPPVGDLPGPVEPSSKVRPGSPLTSLPTSYYTFPAPLLLPPLSSLSVTNPEPANQKFRVGQDLQLPLSPVPPTALSSPTLPYLNLPLTPPLHIIPPPPPKPPHLPFTFPHFPTLVDSIGNDCCQFCELFVVFEFQHNKREGIVSIFTLLSLFGFFPFWTEIACRHPTRSGVKHVIAGHRSRKSGWVNRVVATT